MSVTLRPTTESDLAWVTALERRSDHAGIIGQWSDAEHLLAIRGQDHREHWIIERDSRPAGYLIAYDCRSAGAGIYVKRILVDEKDRGTGRAALAAFLEDAFSRAGVEWAWLIVRNGNERASAVYESLGFRRFEPTAEEAARYDAVAEAPQEKCFRMRRGARRPDADRGAFRRKLRIFDAGDASKYAAELFAECFNAPFPLPRESAGLPIPTPPGSWRQYVALYRWEEGREETVGFCNWIKHRDVYLEGGLCVRRSLYRRLPEAERRECDAAGRVARILMEQAEPELRDCKAWFAYSGDARALAVLRCVGYVPTGHRHLLVRWFAVLPEGERQALIDEIARIGPF